MSSPLATAIENLSARESALRFAAASEIYRTGRTLAERATRDWYRDPELAVLLESDRPVVTVGLAVHPETFAHIREANSMPPLADVPPDQNAQEFELHFPEGIALDVLTTRERDGTGAIARYLSRLGEGIQQVEYRCSNVDRASAILQQRFGLTTVYPQARAGVDGTRINFFLVPTEGGGKVLIELYEVRTQIEQS
jgi:hypothetical protein